MRALALISEADFYMSSKNTMIEQIAKRQAASGDPAAVLAWIDQEKVPGTKLQALRGLAEGIVERVAPPAKKTD